MHEFIIASVYEGPNPVLSDMGAPNAMTRDIRAGYPRANRIGGSRRQVWTRCQSKIWLVHCQVCAGFVESVRRVHLMELKTCSPKSVDLAQKGLKRNRVLGRRILFIIAKYQKTFMDQSFLLGY